MFITFLEMKKPLKREEYFIEKRQTYLRVLNNVHNILGDAETIRKRRIFY
jgi:hypothetical protein